MKKHFYFLVLLCLSLNVMSGQTSNYPKDYFRSPLNIPLVLSGNFGELRPNHFHSGIDIKTQGVTGKKIFCAADGYVSRIKISTSGYGKALYVTHPNGFTTVYAHLESFNEAIENYVKEMQYAKKSFKIELFPTAGMFPLKKGDVIAISGNSGGSLAPHLHFEIRDSKTEYPLNPLLFGFDITDKRPPVVKSISVYPLNNESYVDGLNQRRDYPVQKIGNKYAIKGNIKPRVNGLIGFGVETYDLLDAAGNHCGLFSINLAMDNVTIYEHRLEKFSFYETRYMNALMDYGKYYLSKRKTQRSFILPNNKLSIYKNTPSKGMSEFMADEKRHLSYTLKDVYGNISLVDFEVMGVPKTDNAPPRLSQKPSAIFKCKEKNTFQNEHIIAYLPPNILYEDLKFKFALKDTMKNALTPTYRIHNETVPLQGYMMLSIKNADIPVSLRKKTLVVSRNKKGGFYAEGGTWKGDYMVIKTRSFGDYAIMADTTNPKVSGINIKEGADLSKKWSIMVKIQDNLSGIKSYYPTVDGEWILMEYDKKNNRLTHFFDERISSGKHIFKITVKDKVGNVTEYQANFTR